MKKITISLIISLIYISSFASHYVNSYTTSNGSYVEGHQSMDPYESQNTGEHYHNNQIYSNNY